MFPRHLSPGKTPQILGGLSKTSFPGTSLMVHSVRNKNYYLLNKKNCRYLWPFWTENTFWPNFCYFFRALRWFKKAKINIKYSLTILEFLVVLVWSLYMNGPSKLDAWFLSNTFLGLNYVFSVQVWYICLNLIDLSKKKYILFIQNWI